MNLLRLRPTALGALLFAGCLALPAASAAETTAADVIKQARAFLGGEEALAAVRSIRFAGSIKTADERVATIEIIVRRPMQQRTTVSIGKGREITVLDGYEAWSRLEDVDNPGRYRLNLLEVPAIRLLRAEVAENIGFFHGAQEIGGSTTLLGETEIDGIKCHQLEFTYGGKIRFVRYFDVATGRLVRTETHSGTTISESGEKVVAGVRFPKQLTSVTNGRTAIVSFDTIEVNVDAPDELFKMPLVIPTPIAAPKP
jgi:hypothetical protein